MDQGNISPQLAHAAQDPNTDAEYLRRLAYHFPALRPLVARNPAAYDGLLQWLADNGVTEAQQVLDSRAAARAGAQVPALAQEALAKPEAVVQNHFGPEDGAAGEANAAPDLDATQVLPAAAASPTAAEYGNWQDQVQTAPDAGNSSDCGLGAEVDEVQKLVGSAVNSHQAVPSIGLETGVGFGAGGGFTPGAEFDARTGTGLENRLGLDASQQAKANTPSVQEAALKKRWTTVVITILSVLSVVLAVAVVLIYTGVMSFSAPRGSVAPQPAPTPSVGEHSSASPDETPSPSDTTAESASPSSTPTPSEKPVRYPAPAGAIEGTGFNTPSHNILCKMRADYATCSVSTSEWTSQSRTKCSTDPQTVTVTEEGVTLDCANAAVGDGFELEYNQTMKQGDMVCSLTLDGVSCWNTRSGQSFAVAKRGWVQGASGRIEPTVIP